MIDSTVERCYQFVKLPLSAFPGWDKLPHRVTIAKWRTQGVRGVLLETLLIGNRRVTSCEAIARFFEAVSAAESLHPRHKHYRPCLPLPRTERERSKAAKAASKALELRGA